MRAQVQSFFFQSEKSIKVERCDYFNSKAMRYCLHGNLKAFHFIPSRVSVQLSSMRAQGQLFKKEETVKAELCDYFDSGAIQYCLHENWRDFCLISSS